MNRRDFLCNTAGAVAAGAMAGAGAAERPTNVLFIMTDQQYGGCVGYAGHPYVKTPHIDALAADGVVFDNAYCAFPVCTASRGSLVTGLWPHTHGCNLNVGSPERDPGKGLPPDAVMTESILHDAGYTTKHRGKWHLGDQQRHPCYQSEDGYRHMHRTWRQWLVEHLPKDQLKAPPSDRELYGYPIYMTPETKHAQDVFHEKGWTTPQDITFVGRTAIPHEYMEDTWVTDETLALLDTYGDQPFMTVSYTHLTLPTN